MMQFDGSRALLSFSATMVLGCGVLLPITVASCGRKGDGRPQGSEGGGSSASAASYTKVTLKSAAAAALRLGTQPRGCHLGLTQTVQGNGTCLSPSEVELWANGVFLASQSPSAPGSDPASNGPGRILGGGSGFSKDGYIDGGRFNLAQAASMRGQDNLFHKYKSKPQFDLVTVESAYVRASFELKGETWEMLVPFYDQPVEDISVLKECVDSGYLEAAKRNGNLLPGIAFKAGDFLFCKRDEASTACALSAFKWFDAGVNALAAPRPANPKRLSSLSGLTRKCNKKGSDGAPADMAFQMPALRADLSSPVKVYGDFSHGPDSGSNQGASRPAGVSEEAWNERSKAGKATGPYAIYFLEAGGETKRGNKLGATVTFDSSDWIFFDGIQDLTSASTDAALAALTTKEFFAWEKIGFSALGGVEGGWKAALEINLSDISPDEIYATPAPGATPEASTAF